MEPGIEPIQQLSLSNGSLSLLFLDASDIVYYNSTEDPWFSATTSAADSFLSWSKARRPFIADEPVGVMGCAVRRFYCNPALPEAATCVDGFAEYNKTQDTITKIWPDVREQSKMRAIISALTNRGVGYLDLHYAIPSVPTLLARNTVLGNLQTAPLPIDHWKDEREYLFQASLADMQSAVVEHARGLDLGQGIFCNNATSCYRSCKSQKIRSSSHYSFSAWTLGTVVIAGCILILISTFAEELLGFLIRVPKFQTKKLIYSLAEWQAGSTLQLQRLAHKSLGLGHWARTDEAIPVTQPGELLGVLDITNIKHARIIAQSEELNALEPVDAVVSIETPSSRYTRLPSTENL
ncbi:hypothetical protein E8E11_003585 [Didymella keratinophila]|nr:hypothetical protein E8E11_003585 [Didymella keratinophila]